MTEEPSGQIAYRVVRLKPHGAAWFVVGPRGLLRSGLPEPTVAAARRKATGEFPDAVEVADLWPEFVRQLEDYFRGGRVTFKARLDWSRVTPFQRDVYRRLRRVPFGRTITYGALATAAGHPGAARGVGMAMKRNPFPPVVPCHRVKEAGGGLGGFSASGGIEQKKWLLAMESQSVSRH
ncbi:MAG TPA: methylated-DNA--[protein]-cysteine S-methyltransferase [Planctomycetes bacterium]|nr:methylated-DNA--[protein]-cysteine S-methyltransferase [Planctomycetota bacterium]